MKTGFIECQAARLVIRGNDKPAVGMVFHVEAETDTPWGWWHINGQSDWCETELEAVAALLDQEIPQKA